MNKIYPDAHSALNGAVEDGMTLAVGGFGLCGNPEQLICALRDAGKRQLTIISNNAGIDGVGLGMLLNTRQVRKMISSYVEGFALSRLSISLKRESWTQTRSRYWEDQGYNWFSGV